MVALAYGPRVQFVVNMRQSLAKLLCFEHLRPVTLAHRQGKLQRGALGALSASDESYQPFPRGQPPQYTIL